MRARRRLPGRPGQLAAPQLCRSAERACCDAAAGPRPPTFGALHFSPLITGHAVCRERRSISPEGLIEWNSTAEPLRGLAARCLRAHSLKVGPLSPPGAGMLGKTAGGCWREKAGGRGHKRDGQGAKRKKQSRHGCQVAGHGWCTCWSRCTLALPLLVEDRCHAKGREATKAWGPHPSRRPPPHRSGT